MVKNIHKLSYGFILALLSTSTIICNSETNYDSKSNEQNIPATEDGIKADNTELSNSKDGAYKAFQDKYNEITNVARRFNHLNWSSALELKLGVNYQPNKNKDEKGDIDPKIKNSSGKISAALRFPANNIEACTKNITNCIDACYKLESAKQSGDPLAIEFAEIKLNNIGISINDIDAIKNILNIKFEEQEIESFKKHIIGQINEEKNGSSGKRIKNIAKGVFQNIAFEVAMDLSDNKPSLGASTDIWKICNALYKAPNKNHNEIDKLIELYESLTEYQNNQTESNGIKVIKALCVCVLQCDCVSCECNKIK